MIVFFLHACLGFHLSLIWLKLVVDVVFLNYVECFCSVLFLFCFLKPSFVAFVVILFVVVGVAVFLWWLVLWRHFWIPGNTNPGSTRKRSIPWRIRSGGWNLSCRMRKASWTEKKYRIGCRARFFSLSCGHTSCGLWVSSTSVPAIHRVTR